ncbi:SpaH/EbpB family LPXTG-anchored major pilin [Siminovitchia terrae]|uniref:SpaH/EbpB family LPXTG-anchored major pilin n=1 Tax=Siminovitchia terrae TaxID=1914933 RepID=UPI0028AE0CE1|nr:SpaH/EbpB family LPXTG-anchored major pilin [Siminovitchia terrae]
MAIAKKKSLHILLAFTLLVSLFIPSIALAYDTKGDPNNPTLTIHKFEQEPGAKPGDEGTGLPGQNAEGTAVEGVQFTLKLTHKYDVENDQWTEVADGKTIQGTTGANGQVVFTKAEGLELGRYEVTETDGPSHIILNPDSFFVDVPMTSKDGATLNYDVHVYPKNETIRSDVELVKKDEDGNPLKGVSFKLYNADGTPAKDNNGNVIPELTTGADGKIKVAGLAAGKYYFQETKVPAGYALNTTKIEFEVKKTGDKGQDIEVVWKKVDGFVDNGVVTNYKTPEVEKDVEGEQQVDIDRDKEFKYNLTIKTPKDIDKYKSLGLTDTLDNRLEYAGSWEVTGTAKENIDFKQEGQKLIWEVKDLSQLEPGKEIKITFTAKIKPDAVLEPEETGIPNTADLDFNNDRGWYGTEKPTNPPVVTPTEGGLKVIKVDSKDNKIKLEGAEFKLTDKDGNVIDTSNAGKVVKVNGEVFNGKLENLKTGKDGSFNITGLTPGTYYLHETKAPTYTDEKGNVKPYRLLTKPVEVKVENKKDLAYEVENSKSGWELPTTGGIGTILFTLIGLGLMMTAFALYLRRRKSEAQVG